MKLSELIRNQRISVQLKWDEKTIEFTALVMDCDKYAVYITPYTYNGKELDINVTADTKVVCNLYANDNTTHKRVSWKAIELTTVNHKDAKVYCIKAHSYNNSSCEDDRREHERIPVEVDAWLADTEEIESVTIHDISDNGLGIYAPGSFEPKSRQITVTFTDSIGDQTFNFKLACDIARMSNENGRLVIGCRLKDENREYQVYEFLKRIRLKYGATNKEDVINTASNTEKTKINTFCA